MRKLFFFLLLNGLLSACGGAGTVTPQSKNSDIQDITPQAGELLLSPVSESLALYQGDIMLPVNWRVQDFAAVNYWAILLDGKQIYEQHISPLQQLNSLKSLHDIQPGEHQLQVQACDADGVCLHSNKIVFSVTNPAADTALPGSLRLFSLYDSQRCLSYDIEGLKLETCSDVSRQRWIIRENSLSPEDHPELCVSAGNYTSASRAQLAICGSAAEFNWQFSAQIFANNDFALDVDRSTNLVIIYPRHGGLNQQWTTSAPQTDSGISDNTDNTDTSTGNTDSGAPGAVFGTSYDPQWTFLNMPAEGNYGHYEFDVPALQNWVNSGLFLRKGQSVTITARGSWSVKNGDSYGPEGHASATARGCAEGSLVARQGLYYKDAAITCIGKSGTFTALRDDIVYIGAVVSNDLGESYEARINASGSVHVTLDAAEGLTVPVVPMAEAADYPFANIASGWVEILGEHIILTLPVRTALADAAALQAAVQRLDAMYNQHMALRGLAPFKGQPVRFYPDTSDAPGWMLAGNPVRMDPALVDASRDDRISNVAADGINGWGFAHELGHEFNFAGGSWSYTSGIGLEAWPNIFSVHAIEMLGLPERKIDCAALKQKQLNAASLTNLQQDPWTGLCFLLEFKNRFGWEFYQRFYQAFNAKPGSGWAFLRTRFSEAAGQDVNAIFDEWYLPKQ